jgi:hypothetical protein
MGQIFGIVEGKPPTGERFGKRLMVNFGGKPRIFKKKLHIPLKRPQNSPEPARLMGEVINIQDFRFEWREHCEFYYSKFDPLRKTNLQGRGCIISCLDWISQLPFNHSMTSHARTMDQMASHAVCMAASIRDCARAAQFYTRDMTNVDGGRDGDQRAPTLLSRWVAGAARLADRVITWGANASIALFLPSWRNLPSPFSPGILQAVANAIQGNGLLHNPLFNAYFFRAATRIVYHYAERPNLVLEHRVDAARRSLARGGASYREGTGVDFMAGVLLTLVEAKPVARIGRVRQRSNLLDGHDPNVAVFSIAIAALLFAEDGQPVAIRDDDEFFSVVGALIQPRLAGIEAAISAGDRARLAQELEAIKALY